MITQLLLCSALFASPAVGAIPGRVHQDSEAPKYESWIASAQASLDQEQWENALACSAAAVGEAPERYEAYLIASLALHSSARHEQAMEALEEALRLAPQERQAFLAKVQRELAAATGELAFEQHLKKGRAALQNNLAALAAKELTAAWSLKPEAIEIAIEAVTAWIVIEQYGPARALLTTLLVDHEERALQLGANELLELVEPLTLHQYSQLLSDAERNLKQGQLEQASSLLSSAAQLLPEAPDAHLAFARLAVLQHTPEQAVLCLRRAIQRGVSDPRRVLGDPALRPLLDQPSFQTLISEAFGEGALRRYAPSAAPGQGVAPSLTNSIGMQLIHIQPGSFLMGSPTGEKGRDNIAEVQTEVSLRRGFYLGRTEVTQAQWMAVMESNPSVSAGEDLPVQRITWLQAAEFCQRLSEREGATYRLPTEAEWEFSCRAGAQSPYSPGLDGRKLADQALYANSKPKPQAPQPVAQLTPNAWGLHDMQGNVYEWVLDYYGPLAGTPQVDPPGPQTGTLRVLRGGSFASLPSACRSAHRARFPSSQRSPGVGFRVLRELN